MSASAPVDNSAEEDAKAETAALIKELKEQLQKAEASTEEFKVCYRAWAPISGSKVWASSLIVPAETS